MIVSPAHDNATEEGWLSTEPSSEQSKCLLGPTEPDQVSPGSPPYNGYPVVDVINLWGRIYEPWRSSTVSALNPNGRTGRRLGAPAVAQSHPADVAGLWFDQFMTSIASNGYHVDFIPVHFFTNFSAASPALSATGLDAGVSALHDYIFRVWQKYGKPVWPEISAFESVKNAASAQQLADYDTLCRRMFAQLNSENCPRTNPTCVVERWDFWPLGPQIYSQWGLYEADGTISTVGSGMKLLPSQ